MEFCQVQVSLSVDVVRSPILAALLDGTLPVDVSQTLRRGTRKGITERSLLVLYCRYVSPSIFGYYATAQSHNMNHYILQFSFHHCARAVICLQEMGVDSINS